MYGVSSVIATAIVLSLLAIVAVCLRFYTRIRLTRTFVGIDDWLIALSCFLVLCQCTCQIVSACIGDLGRDGEPTVGWRALNQNRINGVVLILEKLTYTFIKLSVLFFYRRIFIIRKSFRIVNSILIVFITLWGLIFFTAEAIITYDSTHIKHDSESQRWFLLWFAITDVSGDIAILTLPYPCIRKLHTSRRNKVGLTIVFSLGTLSLVFGLVRLSYVTKLFINPPSLIYPFFDPSYGNINGDTTPATFWTTAEVSIGLLAACLPPLKPLLTHISSPRKAYDSMKHGLALHNPGRREAPQRLSSVENVSEMARSNEGKTEPVKEVGIEMADYRIEVEENGGLTRALESSPQ